MNETTPATAQLDPILEQWRTRLLGEITYLYLDARYEAEQRDPPADAGGEYLSERSVVPPLGQCDPDGDQRGLGHRQGVCGV
jgi:hypothetical protein